MTKRGIGRHAANAITLARILLCVVAFFYLHSKAAFFALYLTAALTDALDGYVARRLKTESSLGARLDSIADIFLFALALAGWWIWASEPFVQAAPAVVAVLVLRFGSIGVGVARYRFVIFLHTLLNKAAGLVIIAALPLYGLVENRWIVILTLFICIVSAAEELLIIFLSKTRPDSNIKSIIEQSKRCSKKRGKSIKEKYDGD